MTINNIDSPIDSSRSSGRGKASAIIHFDVELNSRQQSLLDNLPEYDSRFLVGKDEIGMADLAAMTAKTGDEFALFTKGTTRLVVRGNASRVNIAEDEAIELANDGYTWSGHTHPGVDANCLIASGGDRLILRAFKQKESVIYNSKGDFEIFREE